MLVVERLHLLIGNVDAQLLVRVNDEILETKNVENSDCTTFTGAQNKQNVIYYSAPTPTNQPTIYFPQLKQIQSEHCKQQRKATREAVRLNELVAYVKKLSSILEYDISLII